MFTLSCLASLPALYPVFFELFGCEVMDVFKSLLLQWQGQEARAGVEAEGAVRRATAFLLGRIEGAAVAWTLRLR